MTFKCNSLFFDSDQMRMFPPGLPVPRTNTLKVIKKQLRLPISSSLPTVYIKDESAFENKKVLLFISFSICKCTCWMTKCSRNFKILFCSRYYFCDVCAHQHWSLLMKKVLFHLILSQTDLLWRNKKTGFNFFFVDA